MANREREWMGSGPGLGPKPAPVISKYYSVILINYNIQPGVLTFFFILFAFILLEPVTLYHGQRRVEKASSI